MKTALQSCGRNKTTKKRKMRNIIAPIDGLLVDEDDYKVVNEIYQNCVQHIRNYMRTKNEIKLLDIRTMFDVKKNDSNFRIHKVTILENSQRYLPESLLRLDALEVLTIVPTRMVIPKWLGNLKHLQRLTIFLGEDEALPVQALELSNLRVLEVCGGTRAFFPPKSIINKNTSLRELSISLEHVPEEIGYFSNLQTLRFGPECRSIPDSIGSLKKNLQSLIFQDCHDLHTLPEEVGDLTNLQVFRVWSCSGLRSLPQSIGNLVNLKVLDLDDSSELLALPRQIGNLSELEFLNLKGCLGLSDNKDAILSIGNLQKLRVLNLSELEHLVLPEGIGNLKQLEHFDVSYSKFVSFPSSLRNLQSIQEFQLEGCTDDANNRLQDILGISIPHIIPDDVC